MIDVDDDDDDAPAFQLPLSLSFSPSTPKLQLEAPSSQLCSPVLNASVTPSSLAPSLPLLTLP